MANIAVDFDGTCVVALPEAGESYVDTGSERVLKRLIEAGHNIILWTCRNHSDINPYNRDDDGCLREKDSLDIAINWFRERGIPLLGINEVPNEEIYIGYSRKPLYDILIDDKNIGSKLVYGDAEYVSFDTGEIKSVNTYCIDWDWVEKSLEQSGFL